MITISKPNVECNLLNLEENRWSISTEFVECSHIWQLIRVIYHQRKALRTQCFGNESQTLYC